MLVREKPIFQELLVKDSTINVTRSTVVVDSLVDSSPYNTPRSTHSLLHVANMKTYRIHIQAKHYRRLTLKHTLELLLNGDLKETGSSVLYP